MVVCREVSEDFMDEAVELGLVFSRVSMSVMSAASESIMVAHRVGSNTLPATRV